MRTFPSRQAIEQSEPITFEPKPVQLVVHTQHGEWPIDVELSIALDKLPVALNRLAAAGLTPRQQEAAPRLAKAKPPTVTEFTPAGIPLCPIHRKPMSESQHGGWYCREKGGDCTNERGYCRCIDK